MPRIQKIQVASAEDNVDEPTVGENGSLHHTCASKHEREVVALDGQCSTWQVPSLDAVFAVFYRQAVEAMDPGALSSRAGRSGRNLVICIGEVVISEVVKCRKA